MKIVIANKNYIKKKANIGAITLPTDLKEICDIGAIN
jgi:hypothetical protein